MGSCILETEWQFFWSDTNEVLLFTWLQYLSRLYEAPNQGYVHPKSVLLITARDCPETARSRNLLPGDKIKRVGSQNRYFYILSTYLCMYYCRF